MHEDVYSGVWVFLKMIFKEKGYDIANDLGDHGRTGGGTEERKKFVSTCRLRTLTQRPCSMPMLVPYFGLDRPTLLTTHWALVHWHANQKWCSETLYTVQHQLTLHLANFCIQNFRQREVGKALAVTAIYILMDSRITYIFMQGGGCYTIMRSRGGGKGSLKQREGPVRERVRGVYSIAQRHHWVRQKSMKEHIQ